jgi:hypothetical protein
LEKGIAGGLSLEMVASKNDAEDLILNARDSLVDLSLNYNSVHFLDKSCFLDLTGNHNEEIDDIFPTAG